MSTRLIALDIDGTILDRPTGLGVPPQLRSAVAEARSAGIVVALCTSRMSFSLQDALQGTDDWAGGEGDAITVNKGVGLGPIDAVVAASGAEIIVGSQTICRIPLSAGVWETTLRVASCLNLFAAIGTTNEMFILQQGNYNPAAANDPPFVRVLPETEFASALSAAQSRGEDALLGYLYGLKSEQLPEVSLQLSAAGAEVVPAGDTSLLATSITVTKGQGLLALARHLNIPAQDIMAVGNDLNDLPMFAAAGLAVAVGNAPDEVRAAADYVVADVWHAGAAQAIRELALVSLPEASGGRQAARSGLAGEQGRAGEPVLADNQGRAGEPVLP